MNAELTNTRKRTRLDRKFDRLRDAEEAGKLGKSKTSRAVRKMLENRLAVIGLVVFAIILISCLLAPLISPYDPLTTDLRAMTQPPSLQHLFGTDKLGRDVFSRTLYGGRLSILIGLGSALGAAVIGVLLGCYGGYKGGLFDKIVLRLSEIFMSFPQLILVMMLGTIFGRGLWNLIFIFILTGWARLQVERLLTERMHRYEDGKIAVAPVSLSLMDEAGATEEDMEDIAAFLGQIEGVETSVTIRELAEGGCKLSVRTSGGLNATKVCARLGGGGHAAAGGCTVSGTLAEAEAAILDAIRQVEAGA